MRLTEKRLALLAQLQDGKPFCVAMLANVIAPRSGGYPWSAQAAARWGGGYVRALEKEGLVKVDRYIRSGVGNVRITASGLAALRNGVPTP